MTQVLRLEIDSDFAATAVTFAVVLLWLKAIEAITAANIVSAHVTRKTLHIGTGLIFLLCWNLYPRDSDASRLWASTVPFAVTAKFALVGLGLLRDQTTVDSMSRSGAASELLRGPLMYGVVFVLSTYFFWRTPSGVVALVTLCVGDGFAELIGRRFGRKRLPWSRNKTWAGSIAFFISSLVVCWFYIELARDWRWFIGGAKERLPSLLATVSAATLVESVSGNDYDNLTVFAAAMATMGLFGG